MFEKILIANRGEIALRILRACKELGIETVAVHSTADADAMHVRLADESVCIGPPPARDSYLNIPAILAACEITGADAMHPGLRLPVRECALRRDPRRAQASSSSAPSPSISASWATRSRPSAPRRRLGMPVVPGSEGGVGSDAGGDRDRRRDIGFPVLVKAAAGGGGRGMKVARTGGRAFDRARDRARRSQGRVRRRRRLYREISATPRHIEIQVLGDGKGNAIHLGERDCSLQRRHQKVWEEGPSPGAQRRARATAIGETVAQGDARARLSRRRHGRVPLRGRRVLLHRDEHAHPGRASGDRDDHRHRSRPRADPRRRRGRAHAHAGGRQVPRPRHRVPHQCREPGDVPALARQDRCTIIRPAGSACASIPRSTRATRSRPITTR